VSRYAWGGDYHRTIQRQLRALVDHLRRDVPGVTVTKGHVDTAPVAEKAWAHTAGVGWVGKHSNVITRDRGSWVFLAELLTDADLEPDAPATDHCGTCTRCIDACPTAAIVAPAVVDSRRCISYLTIEHREAIDPALRPGMGDWIFGCDICQDVCPWNKFSRPTPDARYAPRPEQATPRLAEIARLGPEAFAARFTGTNLRRPGWRGVLRNVMVALGNAPASEAGEAVPTLIAALEHPEPLVRGHAAWGLGRHQGDAERARLRRHRDRESDASVVAEIEAALG
jgi:epoxyqueuosine reductase